MNVLTANDIKTFLMPLSSWTPLRPWKGLTTNSTYHTKHFLPSLITDISLNKCMACIVQSYPAIHPTVRQSSVPSTSSSVSIPGIKRGYLSFIVGKSNWLNCINSSGASNVCWVTDCFFTSIMNLQQRIFILTVIILEYLLKSSLEVMLLDVSSGGWAIFSTSMYSAKFL